MAVRLRVEVGPSEDQLHEELVIDIDDLLEVIERLGEGPVVWTWQTADGTTMRLTAELDDTPGTPDSTTG